MQPAELPCLMAALLYRIMLSLVCHTREPGYQTLETIDPVSGVASSVVISKLTMDVILYHSLFQNLGEGRF